MPDTREKLTELLKNSPMLNVRYHTDTEWECATDYLLANGITIGHEPFRQALLDKLCLAQENALGTDRGLLGEVIRMVEDMEVKL